MLNLIRFEFKRITKSVFYRIVLGYCVLWPVIVAVFYRILFGVVLSDAGRTFKDFDMPSDEIMYLTWMLAVGFVNELPKFIALFTCLHIGRDFSDGIVRNKIIAGHTRTSIFFSYMITQICATVVLCLTYSLCSMLGLTVTGIGANINGGEMFIRIGVAISIVLVLTVIFVVFSLMFRKRAVPIILSIILVMVMSTATSVMGRFNMPSKAVDDYIEARHERYEEMVDDGILTDDDVEKLEKEFGRDYYLDLSWKICHPAYLVSNLGFNGDYSTDLVQMLSSYPEYDDEIDFSKTLTGDGINMDMSGLTPKDFKHTDSMHMSYAMLNLIYVVRSLIWIIGVGGWGYIIFRKKNLF